VTYKLQFAELLPYWNVLLQGLIFTIVHRPEPEPALLIDGRIVHAVMGRHGDARNFADKPLAIEQPKAVPVSDHEAPSFMRDDEARAAADIEGAAPLPCFIAAMNAAALDIDKP